MISAGDFADTPDYRYLRKLVRTFMRRHDGFQRLLDEGELLSVAWLAYREAIRSFDSGAGSRFYGWVGAKVTWALMDFLTTELKLRSDREPRRMQWVDVELDFEGMAGKEFHGILEGECLEFLRGRMRERDFRICGMVAEGYSVSEIAARLGVSLPRGSVLRTHALRRAGKLLEVRK